jgi:hypothetical protein
VRRPTLERVAFPPSRWVLPAVLGGLAATFAAALLVGAGTRHRALVAAAGITATVAAASIIAGLMYVAGAFGRYGIQEAVALRLSIVLVAAAALDAALRRRARG